MENLHNLLTIPQVARRVGASEATIRGYVRRNLIQPTTVGCYSLIGPDQAERAAEIYNQNRRRIA